VFSLKKPPDGELTNLVLVCAKKGKKGYSSCKEKTHLCKAGGVSNPIEWWVAIYSGLYKERLQHLQKPPRQLELVGESNRC